MRSLITQLQTENGALKKSVRALEGRLGCGGNSDGLHKSAANGTATTDDGAFSITSLGALAPPTRAGTLPSVAINSRFGLGHDATMPASAAASLVARVEALESGFARQQQHIEDRQTRVTSALHELVKAEVGSEISQVRALAREAARDSAEDLLKLRLSALQSSTQADLQRALHAASASETVAQHVQQQCHESEQRLSSHMLKVQAQLSEWQRTHGGNASGSTTVATSGTSQQEKERVAAVERRLDEQLRSMQSQLQQYRSGVETQIHRLAQQHNALSGVVEGKADAAELLAVREHLGEQQRGDSSGWMSRDQVTALLRAQLQPLHDEMHKAQTMAQESLDNTNAWKREAARRFATVEAGMKAQSAETQQDQQWQSCARDVQQVRTEMNSVQSRVAEAVRQAKTELVNVWDAKLQLLEERTQQIHRERQQQTDAQLRQLQQTLVEQQEALQRARMTGESVEERLRRTEAALAAVEMTLPRTAEDVRVKYEALQAVMQQTCVLPVTRVQQDIDAAQRKLQAVEEDRAMLNNSWKQQLAEAQHYHEERVQHTREVFEQRFAHHKELYEELRTQQTLQRRATEEQHQQLMDRVRHLQQQQHRFSSVVAPTTVREQSAEVASTHALATAASTSIAGTTASGEYQRSLQLLDSRLQDLDSRLDRVEEASASVPLTIADATSSVAKRLEGLQDRVQAQVEDWQRRHNELERDTERQLSALSRRCSETLAFIDAQSARTTCAMDEALSPLKLVTCLLTDKSCLQHLALRLRDHLALTLEETPALADVRVHLATLAKTLEAVQASMQQAQQEIAGLSERNRADQAPGAVPPSSSEMESATAAEAATARQEMLDLIHNLQVTLEEQRGRQDHLEESLCHLTVQQLATVTKELAEVKQVAESVSLEIAKHSDHCNALQSAQRQQLPTLQKYVQDIVQVVESNQSSQLDPIQLRLRAVEDRQKHLQTRLEEANATQEADVVQRVQELHKRMDQQSEKVHKAVEGQLASLRDEVIATRTDADSLAKRVAATEQAREHVTGMLATLQAAAPPAKAAEALMTPDAVAEEPLDIREIDERLTQLEKQAHDSVSVTAEMLGAFRDQLQNVVGRFAAAAAQLTGHTERSGARAAVAATEGASSPQPPIHSLEDVFLFLLERLLQLQQALQQLQSSTVDTLEILERHEESVASLPMLQHTVDLMADTLMPLAERLGVERGAVCTISPQQQQHHHHHSHTSLFPPSRSSSDSENSEWVSEELPGHV
nr:unnamed protein product [Leishmania braziliensis]